MKSVIYNEDCIEGLKKSILIPLMFVLQTSVIIYVFMVINGTLHKSKGFGYVQNSKLNKKHPIGEWSRGGVSNERWYKMLMVNIKL
jgi:energy-converting hydrogenase Eha subunit F